MEINEDQAVNLRLELLDAAIRVHRTHPQAMLVLIDAAALIVPTIHNQQETMHPTPTT